MQDCEAKMCRSLPGASQDKAGYVNWSPGALARRVSTRQHARWRTLVCCTPRAHAPPRRVALALSCRSQAVAADPGDGGIVGSIGQAAPDGQVRSPVA